MLEYFSKHALLFGKYRIKYIFALPITGFGAVAQLVEQRTENPCVGGSIPSRTTKKSLPFRRAFLF